MVNIGSAVAAEQNADSPAPVEILMERLPSIIKNPESQFEIAELFFSAQKNVSPIADAEKKSATPFVGYGVIRGLGNIATATLELPRNIIVSPGWGIFKGLSMTISRLSSGVCDSLSFGYFNFYSEQMTEWIWNAPWQPVIPKTAEIDKTRNIRSELDHNEFALQLYIKAADQGHANAQYRLGCFYRDGLGKLHKDNAKAIKWFERACMNGCLDAKTALHKLQGF